MRNRNTLGWSLQLPWLGRAYLFLSCLITFMIITFQKSITRDEIEGSIGYIFLMAMVLTSFKFEAN